MVDWVLTNSRSRAKVFFISSTSFSNSTNRWAWVKLRPLAFFPGFGGNEGFGGLLDIDARVSSSCMDAISQKKKVPDLEAQKTNLTKYYTDHRQKNVPLNRDFRSSRNKQVCGSERQRIWNLVLTDTKYIGAYCSENQSLGGGSYLFIFCPRFS